MAMDIDSEHLIIADARENSLDPIGILIVDDEPKNLTVLETILSDPTYRLVQASSGDEALLALMSDEFALLILDVRMPGMTGIELAQLVKTRKKTAQVPIIFLTAYYNEDQHILEGYQSGAVDYLQKPVNAAILRSKVAVYAELHRKNRELAIANSSLQREVAERRQAEQQLSLLNEELENRVRDRTNALEQMDRRKDEFLATLAHELRNPLAPIVNAVKVMQLQGPETPELQWAREVIDRQVNQMRRLIDDLMDISRINQGRIELKRDRVKLASAINDAIETNRPLLEECGHTLTVELPTEDIFVNGDITRLGQVFLNLLNNAAKYTMAGGQIEISLKRVGGEAFVVVRDSGVGIPQEKLGGIFGMFSQIENALSRSQGGLGIGLYLVKKIVSLHGGHIEASSAGMGQGSIFTVRLPIFQQASKWDVPPQNLIEGLSGSKHRILVVDDNKDAGAALSLLLGVMGNTVRTANDGFEAIEIATSYRPNVILLDIGMPGMNGYDVCRSLRSQSWAANAVVVAITGWGQPEDYRKSSDAGFDHHLVKPVAPEALTQLLAKIPSVTG